MAKFNCWSAAGVLIGQLRRPPCVTFRLPYSDACPFLLGLVAGRETAAAFDRVTVPFDDDRP